MRKVILLLCCLLFVGCQQTETSVNQIENKGDLILKQWKYLFNMGDGNEDGYYRLVNSQEGITNILYTDYSSKKEIYLCDKPECQHNDETCTSYVEDGNIEELFVYQDHLYLIESALTNMFTINEDGSTISNQQNAPCIYQMDLNGKNKKKLYQLEEGYGFEAGNLVFDGNDLYLSITKNDDVELDTNSLMQIQLSNELYKIDLQTGESQKIMDLCDNLSNLNIESVDGRNIIFSGYYCQEDPQKYLDAKDYDKYDQILSNSKAFYESYNIDTNETEEYKLEENIGGSYYQGKLYSLDDNVLYAYDLKTKEKKEVLTLDKGYIYNEDTFDDKLIISQWKDEVLQKSYYVSLDDFQIKELNQYKRDPKEMVSILSVTDDQLFIIYDRVGDYEKTWAGTMQYEVKKEYRGLISIDDFFNNQKNYENVSIIEVE